ncbi:hypothetical protein RvY_03036 [Ramazzottius varieornatus]|uniref:Uncharacterized protein n=1 Tax=Ramazzottius varieornatus TaxID=947166 RepID=A0A1D1UTS1_RAMVA|nr:hypothetical protein RvY_03036 [Ramazzottius varieornatus]
MFRNDKSRPDDMTQVPWKKAKHIVWDATVVDALALTNFAMSTVKAGSAADAAERRKITKYRNIAISSCSTLLVWRPSDHEDPARRSCLGSVRQKDGRNNRRGLIFSVFQAASVDRYSSSQLSFRPQYCERCERSGRDVSVLDVKKGESM